MSRTSKLLNRLLIVLEGLENDMFDGSNVMYYNGLEFTKSDWRNLQKAVEKVSAYYDNNCKTSKKFQDNHKEYNRLNRMIYYYKTKPVKSERDFVRLEKLQNKMEKQLDKIDEERKLNMKIKLMKQETEREKRKYEQSGRRIEDEFR